MRVTTERRGIGGGRVERCAGPWRTSGGWWTDRAGPTMSGLKPRPTRSESSWDRDEWDVTLSDRVTYRIFRERDSEKWFVEGVID